MLACLGKVVAGRNWATGKPNLGRYFLRGGSFFVSPKPGLGTRSTVVVFGRRSASFTGMNWPLFELRPMSKVLRSLVVIWISFFSNCLSYLDSENRLPI